MPKSPSFLTDNFYDTVKWLALIAFPALGTAYYGIAQIFGLPHAEQVVGVIVIIDTFLGTLVGISKSVYDKSDARYDGDVTMSAHDEFPDVTNVKTSIDESALGKDEVVLKVKRIV